MSKSTNPNKSRFSFGEKIQSPEVMLKNIRMALDAPIL